MASAADTAANFGYSMAFFQSDPELKALLNSAVKGNWTPQQFVAKLQNTRWFKTKGEAARQMYALKTSDPATFNQRVASARQQIASVANQMVAAVPGGVMAKLSEQALALGWNDDQIHMAVRGYIKPTADGTYRSNAGAYQEQIKEMAADYGFNVSDSTMGSWVRGMVLGQTSIEQLKQRVISNTISKYPGLAERLQSGETLEQIASPYKDSYSKILEVPSTAINLSDPAIQQALSARTKDGKPTTKTVWQFESDLKSDPRWLKTNNARDQLVGNTRKVLQDFGLMV